MLVRPHFSEWGLLLVRGVVYRVIYRLGPVRWAPVERCPGSCSPRGSGAGQDVAMVASGSDRRVVGPKITGRQVEYRFQSRSCVLGGYVYGSERRSRVRRGVSSGAGK